MPRTEGDWGCTLPGHCSPAMCVQKVVGPETLVSADCWGLAPMCQRPSTPFPSQEVRISFPCPSPSHCVSWALGCGMVGSSSPRPWGHGLGPSSPWVSVRVASSARSRGQALYMIIQRGSQQVAVGTSLRWVWVALVTFGDLGFVPVFILVPGGSGVVLSFLYFLIVITWRTARI